MKRIALGSVTLVALACSAAPYASAQTPAAGQPAPKVPAQDPTKAPTTPEYKKVPLTPLEIEAERQKIWNSPEMEHARAWASDYLARSARISPAQAKEYMEELERLTPDQMRQWLKTFEEQQRQRERQRSAFETARQMSVDNAMRANQAARQAQANVARTRNEAARTAQQQLTAQQQAAQQRSSQLVSDRDAAAAAAMQPSAYIWLNTLPWGPYAGYPVGGGAAIDPAAFQGVLGVQNIAPHDLLNPANRERTNDRP